MEEIVRTQIMIMRVSVDFSRFTFILVTLALLVLVGCSRPPEIIGIDNPELRAEAEALSTRHRIFITSTRAPSDEPGALLSANRARTLGLASVDVLVPPTHVLGQLERPTRLPPDPSQHFMAVDPVTYDSDAAFIAGINRELATRPAPPTSERSCSSSTASTIRRPIRCCGLDNSCMTAIFKGCL